MILSDFESVLRYHDRSFARLQLLPSKAISKSYALLWGFLFRQGNMRTKRIFPKFKLQSNEELFGEKESLLQFEDLFNWKSSAVWSILRVTVLVIFFDEDEIIVVESSRLNSYLECGMHAELFFLEASFEMEYLVPCRLISQKDSWASRWVTNNLFIIIHHHQFKVSCLLSLL